MESNLYIVEYLKTRIYFLEKENDKGFKIQAISNVIPIVKNQYHPIVDVGFLGFTTDRKRMKHKKTANIILYALRSVPRDYRWVKEISDIHGVTPEIQAQMWSQGGRTLESVSALSTLSSEMRDYLALREDLVLRVERFEIDYLVEQISRIIPRGHFEFTGEYRRGIEHCDKIQLVILEENYNTLMQNLRGLQYLYSGNHAMTKNCYIDEIKLFSDKPAHTIEIHTVPRQSFYTTIFVLTGDRYFDLQVRGQLSKMKMSMNRKALFNNVTKKPYYPTSEEDIFRAMNVDYIPPNQRNKRM